MGGGRQADLADPAGADPGRLDRARGDRGRARARSPAARSSTRSTSRPAATSSTASCRSRSAHGAALIALTIDEVGMAKTGRAQARDRQADQGARLRRARARPRAADLRRAHLHADDGRRGVAAVGGRDDRGHPPRSRRSCPGVKTSLGVSNVSFGVGQPARAVLNSVFLHHCVEAGLDLAMVNPNHITPYGEIPEDERELADDLVFNRREDALERFIEHFESKGPEERGRGRRPDRGHGARGGAALAHPAPQEGRRRGLDRQAPSRRSAPSRR